MSSVTTYPFTTPGNYTYDTAKVEVDGGVAKLLLQQVDVDFTEDFADDTDFTYDAAKAEFSGGKVQQKENAIIENYSQPFTSDSGFTYNSALVEFASGLARQKSQRIANATFGATYTTSINGSWGNGVLTGTAYNGAAISGNRLDLSGSVSERRVEYAALNNADFTQTGCIKFKYTPNYSGAPTNPQYIVTIKGATNNSRIRIFHYQNGYVRFDAYNNVGVLIGEVLYYWITNTAGTTYEFEFNYDFTAGASRMFLNGNQIGSTLTSTGTRTASDLTTVIIGVAPTEYYKTPDFFLEDLVVFNTVLHTANYTPGYTLLETDYVEASVTAPAVSYSYNIASLGAPTITSANSPKYIINGYYWNGAAWAASSDTYATAMSAADWTTNIATFPGGQLGSSVVVKTVFQTSATLGSIDSMAFDINETHYVDTNVVLPEMAHAGDGTIRLFNSLATTEANSPRYTLQIGRSGDYLYWDGAAWSVSDGTYAQANSAATFNTNAPTLDIDGEIYGQFKINFTESNTQAYVDVLTSNINVDVYPTDDPTILTNSSFSASEVLVFAETVNKSGSDDVKYVIQVDGQDLWNNAGTVENSNGTYVQSNTAAEITAEIDQFVTSRSSVKIKAFIHSDAGTTSPELDLLSLTYDAALPDPTLPTLVDLNGYIYDMNGPISGQTVQARPYLAGYSSYSSGSGVFHKYAWETIATTGVDGFFSGDIYLQPAGKYIEFKIGSQRYYTQLPDQAAVDFSTLDLTVIED